MLVETWMSKPVITVEANDPMQKALELLGTRKSYCDDFQKEYQHHNCVR
ncbi:MAG: hypothetical protein PVF56_20175 [Desulfobacterales bacterium]|jgi:hypothetical protein